MTHGARADFAHNTISRIDIILESMSCGTPVVGFDVGGVPDVVRHGENGFLARAGNVAL